MGCFDFFRSGRKQTQTPALAADPEYRTHRSTVSKSYSSSSSQPKASYIENRGPRVVHSRKKMASLASTEALTSLDGPLVDIPTGASGNDNLTAGIDTKDFASPQINIDQKTDRGSMEVTDRASMEVNIADMEPAGNVEIGASPDATPANPSTTPLDEGYPVEGGVDSIAASALIAEAIKRLPQTVEDTAVLEKGMVRYPILPRPSALPAKAPSLAESRMTDINDEEVNKFLWVITVGISGCSSSGKSTLAFLLAEIFHPTQTPTSMAHVPPKFLTQDDFFKPKAGLPNGTFYEDLNSQFIVSTVREKMEGLYTVLTTLDPKTNIRRWEITGPNSDCPDAIDFLTFQKAVQNLAKAGTINKEDQEEYESMGLGMSQDGKGGSKKICCLETSARDMRTRYADLIQDNRALVKKCLDKHLGDFKFAIVEGFLLFTDPKASPKTATDWQRVALQYHLDIPLFLPTSRKVAKERRMGRMPYVDAPEGGRQPGQMYKAEGYFNDVVWPEYEKEYGWILNRLQDGKAPRGEDLSGICVREGGEDVGVAETVNWAVKCVLSKSLDLAMNDQLKSIQD